MRRTLKYRLYTSEKDKHLVEQIHVAASIWNHSVALTRRYYRLYGKSISTNRLQKHIAKLRRRNPYWQRLGSQAVQDVCQRLDKAYGRFFKDPSRVGRPGFKKRRGYTSFTLKQAGWAYLGSGRMRISGRPYRFVESRPISNQRRDWFFKTAHRLCDRFDLISVEDLNIDGMKRLWGRKVSDLAFAEFASILEWVCLKRGVHFVKVDRFYASTKTCSDCGEKQDLSLSDRMWVCSSCGAVHNRDQNAALNICREGASSLGLGNVRPECRSQIGGAVAA